VVSIEWLQLAWLARQPAPVWGGHMQRNEPCGDPDIPRWMRNGLIQRVDGQGYVITDKGRQWVRQEQTS